MKFLKLLLLLLLIFLSCSDKSKVSGTEGTASETVGILYKSDFALAQDATIIIIEDNATALPDNPVNMDTTFTDSNGTFDLSSLNDGIYNIFGELNGTKSFLKSVIINNSDDLSDTVMDTLGATMDIAGIVKHEYHSDSRYIIGLMPGTGRFFVPIDSLGEFVIEDVAAGEYDIRLISLLQGYLPKDTLFKVNPLVIDTTIDTIIIEFGDIAPVSGLAATYDSLMQVVSLSWNSADSVEAYNVYRTLKGENQELITQTPVTDTLYNDSTVAADCEYTYTVAGVKTGVSGAQSAGFVVNTVSLYDSVKTVGGQGADSSQFNMVGGMAVYKDSLLYVCDIANQRIKVLDDTLGIVRMIPTAGYPFDITVHNDSIILIIDYINTTVHSYSLIGDDLGVLMNLPSNSFLQISTDNNKNIALCNSTDKLVLTYDIDGTLLDSISDTTYLQSPIDIAFDTSGNLHILDGTSNTHSTFNTQTKKLTAINSAYNTPKAIYYNPIKNNVVIAENMSGNIFFLLDNTFYKRLKVNEEMVVSISEINDQIIIGRENSLELYKK